jgi:serine/threonine protein kinase
MRKYGLDGQSCQDPNGFAINKSKLTGVGVLRGRFSDLAYKFQYLGNSGIDLLNKMLTFDPKKRITAKAALQHKYFFEDPLPKPIEVGFEELNIDFGRTCLDLIQKSIGDM